MINLKDFFKQTIAKIISSIIIFAIIVPFIVYDNGIRCIKTPCLNESVGSIVMWLVFSSNFTIYSLKYNYLIIGVILSYLVSCLLILTLNKIRKK